MGILRRIDRRREPRRIAGLPVFVWGVDTQGERFCQEAQARDISQSGALLTGLGTTAREKECRSRFTACKSMNARG